MNVIRACLVFSAALVSVLLSPSSSLAWQTDVPSEQNQSLAEAAKKAQKDKTAHAKKVITDEDVVPQRGPLPALSFDGDDNTDDIIDAILNYKKTHSAEETEKVVHEWFDEYDSILSAAIRGQTATAARRSSTVYNGYWGCQDAPNYQNCVVRRRAEMRGSHDDQMSGWSTVGRIQQAFMKVRNGIMRNNLQYKWFKVRNASGIGSY